MTLVGGIRPLRATAAIERAIAYLLHSETLAEQSERQVAGALRRFGRYLETESQVCALVDVTADMATGFVRCPNEGSLPSLSTMHFRRSILRLLFSVARAIGLSRGDPTLDLWLPPRSALSQRPLTDDEVAVARAVSTELAGTRHAAAWALGEATARTSELGSVRIADVDLDAGRVWLGGGSKTDPRWGRLTAWGVEQLDDWIRHLRLESPARTLLVSRGGGSLESRQASACIALSQVLDRAGLARERDVRPGSVAIWAGVRAHQRGARIEEVARLLGARSLDQAARLIGWRWSNP